MSKKKKNKKQHKSWEEIYLEWLTRISYTPPPHLEKGPVSKRDGVEVYGKQVHIGPSDSTLRTRHARKQRDKA